MAVEQRVAKQQLRGFVEQCARIGARVGESARRVEREADVIRRGLTVGGLVAPPFAFWHVRRALAFGTLPA